MRRIVVMNENEGKFGNTITEKGEDNDYDSERSDIAEAVGMEGDFRPKHFISRSKKSAWSGVFVTEDDDVAEFMESTVGNARKKSQR